MRCWNAFLVLLMLTMTAAAQTAPPRLQDQGQRRAEPTPARIWRAPPGLLQEGRVGMPLAGNLLVGVGRFSVPAPERPRTHTEPISRSSDIARRHRGIAAVGISLRF